MHNADLSFVSFARSFEGFDLSSHLVSSMTGSRGLSRSQHGSCKDTQDADLEIRSGVSWSHLLLEIAGRGKSDKNSCWCTGVVCACVKDVHDRERQRYRHETEKSKSVLLLHAHMAGNFDDAACNFCNAPDRNIVAVLPLDLASSGSIRY